MKNLLEIEILDQNWLAFEDSYKFDLCSHGKIFLKVKGIEILSAKDGDWGISETALALLRSANFDYPREGEDDTIIFHGCGVILMLGCPIRVVWSTKHKKNTVLLEGFKKFPTTNKKDAIIYSEISFEMDRNEYRFIIYNFANKAKTLFEGVEKVIIDEFDRKAYENFWSEFNNLLENIKQ